MAIEQYTLRPPPRHGIAASLAAVASVTGIVLSVAHHPGYGLLLAVLSIPLGLWGMLRSITPEVRGGLVALAGVILGALGLVLSLIVLAIRHL